MAEQKSTDLFTPEIDVLVAQLSRPIVLPAASGEWIAARQAIRVKTQSAY